MDEFSCLSFSGDLLTDTRNIIDAARNYAYREINRALIRRNWLIGQRIAEETLRGKERAAYGKQFIQSLSARLTEIYGKGFDYATLYKCVQFYRMFPQILDSASPEFSALTWTHFRTLLQVTDPEARAWYAKEASDQTWSVRTLQRNISSQYYYRLLSSGNRKPVVDEMERKTAPNRSSSLDFIKNPVIAEFLGMSPVAAFTETQLESMIISNLQKFLIEMGKGYAFVARQQHIRTEKEDYYIDLVFYNYILKCFVLIDLKTSKITHQDVGQMDMYIRMYDAMKKGADDNPTLGIVLCSDTDEDIARYSVLHGNEQLFATKYKLCLPSEEELREEIETQKQIFFLQHSDNQEQDDGNESPEDC